jgi:hypothetical protein
MDAVKRFSTEIKYQDVVVGDTILLYDGEYEETVIGTVIYTSDVIGTLRIDNAYNCIFEPSDRIWKIKELSIEEEPYTCKGSKTFFIFDTHYLEYYSSTSIDKFGLSPTSAYLFGSFTEAQAFLNKRFPSYPNLEVRMFQLNNPVFD